MSNQSSGCFSCLGTLISLTFIGSILFGVTSIAVKVGSYAFGFGSAVNLFNQEKVSQQKKAIDLNDLQIKMQAAEASVKQFHTQLDQGKCKEIYEQANEAFKQVSSQSNLLNVCDKIRRDFGAVKSAQLIDSWGRPTNQDSDKYILNRYQTSFSKSSVVEETFVWGSSVQGSTP
jgi:hypothetical protein